MRFGVWWARRKCAARGHPLKPVKVNYMLGGVVVSTDTYDECACGRARTVTTRVRIALPYDRLETVKQ